jgi:ribosomal protein S27AE
MVTVELGHEYVHIVNREHHICSSKTFDLVKYGMIICPGCHAHGFIEDHEGRNICSKCGGLGFIKKEDDSKNNNKK